MTDTQKHPILKTTEVNDQFITDIKQAYEQAGLLAHKFNEAARVIPGTAFTIKYLSDNGDKSDDLAVTEIESRFEDYSNTISALSKRSKPTVIVSNTPAQDSTGGAYDLAQIARDSGRGIGNVLFLNCAPRKQQRGNNDNNLGEQVYVGLLKDGTIIGATGEESFTFFRDLVEQNELEIFKANVQIQGSQFRSRDYWPLYTLAFVDQLRDLAEDGDWQANLSLKERREFLQKLNLVNTDIKLNLKNIPNAADHPAVVRYDVHENLKLNIRATDIPTDSLYDIDADGNQSAKELSITINGITETLALGKSMFKEGAGKLSCSEGSTGQWKDYKTKGAASASFSNIAAHDGLKWDVDEQGFLQIAVINGSAKEHFKITDEQLRNGTATIDLQSLNHRQQEPAIDAQQNPKNTLSIQHG